MGTVHAKEAPPPSRPPNQSISEACESGTIPVNFAGVDARVDKVHVEGLSRTKDDIIIASVQDLFEASDFEEVMASVNRVREKLGNLGCFKNIGVQIDTSSGADSTPNGVEVTFFVKELRRMIGGVRTVVGSNEGSLVVSLQTPNLFGRGERIEAEYSHGSRQTSNMRLSYIKPLRRKYSSFLTTSIFQNSSDWPWSGYRCIERGLLVDWSFYSKCMVKHNLQYEAAWREMGTISKTSAMSVREQNGHTLKSAIRHILTIDKRDAIIFPTRGNLFRLTSELAGIGGDISFFKNEFYWQYNYPVYKDFILQTTLTAGVLTEGLSGASPGLPDKFYCGGPLSVKGFQTRGVGPRSDGNAVGANVMWGMGLHLFTPLPFRPGRGGFGDLFRLQLFAIFGQCKDIDFGGDHVANSIVEGYRLSSGIGLALRLGQMAQVELNYVIPNIKSGDDVAHPGLQFGVGLNFL